MIFKRKIDGAALIIQANKLWHSLRLAEAMQMYRRAATEKPRRAYCDMMVGCCLGMNQKTLEAALEALGSAITQYERAEDIVGTATAHIDVGTILLRQHYQTSGHDYLVRAERIGTEVHSSIASYHEPILLTRVNAFLAACASYNGDVSAAHSYVASAWEVLGEAKEDEADEMRYTRSWLYRVQALHRINIDEWQQAHELLQHARHLQSGDYPYHDVSVRCLTTYCDAMIALRDGRTNTVAERTRILSEYHWCQNAVWRFDPEAQAIARLESGLDHLTQALRKLRII